MPLDKYQRLPQDNAANQAMQRAPTPPGLPSEGTGEDPPHSTFLPYAPIAALCLGRIVEGMMFSLIFPYINAMVHDLGVAEEDVGKWSAAAECVLFVGGTISGPFFGHLGDRFGRRPVYLLTLLGWAVGSIVFGLMRSLPGVIIGRALLGFMSGPGVLSRTIIGEITDESNAVKAFALFSPAIIVGMTLGPVVGGMFAEPVPRLLSGEWKVFDEYPYLLPAVITSFFSVVVIGMAAKYIPETRKPSRDITSANTGSQDNEADIPLMRQDSTHKGRDGDDDTKAVPTYVWPRMKQLLSHRKFQTMLLFFCVTSPLMVAYEASFPLYAYTPPDLGGLGLSVRLIGYIMGIAALFGIVLTIAAFPPIHNKLGTPGSLLLCTGCHALAAIFFPLIVHANKGMESGKLSFGAVCLLSVHFIVRKVGDFVGTLLDALVMGSLPAAEHLGMANALIFSIRQLARAFGIYGIAFVFSLSAKAPSETLGREMWWILFFAVNLPGIWLVYVTQYRSR